MVRVAFTGHRPNKLFGYDYNRPEYVRLKELIKAHLIDAITDSVNNTDEDVIEVIIGMALGLDQITALTAIEMRNEGYHIKLVAAIPFKGQESNWPDASKKLYYSILSKIDDIVYVCEEGYAPYKMQKRNMWMVDRLIEENDRLIALWDGTSGGTKNCVDYAKKKGKPVIYMNPKTMQT